MWAMLSQGQRVVARMEGERYCSGPPVGSGWNVRHVVERDLHVFNTMENPK